MKNFFYLKTSKQDSIYARTAHGTHPVTRVSNVIRGEAVFDTLGKTESAHHAGGPTPYKGWVPLLRWVRGGRGEGGASPLPPTTKDVYPLSPTAKEGKIPLLWWVGGGNAPLPLPPPHPPQKREPPLIRGGPSSKVGTVRFPHS